MKGQLKYFVGIDEVGRGPLAGPVAVGLFLSENKNFKNKEIKDLFSIANDSKKLTPQNREQIFKKVKDLQKRNLLQYVVVNQSSKVIDKKGISFAISKCIEKGFKNLKVLPKNTQVFLDGGLKAPKEFVYQETIIKGDQKNKLISLASIVAKVSRDKLMEKLSKKYPKYGLDIHKGYGTQTHRKMIKALGLCPIHRASFCKNLVHLDL